MKGALKITEKDIKKIEKIQGHIKSYNNIMAIVESASLAYDLVINSHPDLQGECPEVCESAIEKLSGDIFRTERQRMGMDYKSKKS